MTDSDKPLVPIMSREERFARKMAGGGGSGVSATMATLLLEIDEATDEIRKMRENGATAKEMAASLKYVSVLTLLENLSGEDRRLANDAAKELLKVGVDEAPRTVVNVLNIDQGDLARKLAFLDALRGRGQPDKVGNMALHMGKHADIEVDMDRGDIVDELC